MALFVDASHEVASGREWLPGVEVATCTGDIEATQCLRYRVDRAWLEKVAA